MILLEAATHFIYARSQFLRKCCVALSSEWKPYLLEGGSSGLGSQQHSEGWEFMKPRWSTRPFYKGYVHSNDSWGEGTVPSVQLPASCAGGSRDVAFVTHYLRCGGLPCERSCLWVIHTPVGKLHLSSFQHSINSLVQQIRIGWNSFIDLSLVPSLEGMDVQSHLPRKMHITESHWRPWALSISVSQFLIRMFPLPDKGSESRVLAY